MASGTLYKLEKIWRTDSVSSIIIPKSVFSQNRLAMAAKSIGVSATKVSNTCCARATSTNRTIPLNDFVGK